MDENLVFGHHPDFHAATGQQLIQLPVALPVQEGLHGSRGFVPALLQGGLADVFGDCHVGSIQLTVAYNLNLGDAGDFLPYQFKNGTPEVAGNPPVGFGSGQTLGEKGMVQPFPAGGKALYAGRHGREWARRMGTG